MTAQVSASLLIKAISGVFLGSVAAFSAAFALLLERVFAQISTAANFFGSANVMMYLTVEGMFLSCIIAGAYFVLKR